MCLSNNNVKYCIKHNCSYVQRGSSDRMHCRECTNERNRNTVRSQKAKENKRQYDKNYAIKKRLENPDLLKLAQEKYKQTDKYQEKLNYYKFKNKEGQYWSKLEIKNTNNKDISISINNKFWNKESELFLLTTTNELVKLDTSNFNGFNYSFKKTIGDGTKPEVSRNVSFGMSKNSTINLIIKHPSDFDPNSGDGFVVSNYEYKSEMDR